MRVILNAVFLISLARVPDRVRQLDTTPKLHRAAYPDIDGSLWFATP
jgi:hypothetical protein